MRTPDLVVKTNIVWEDDPDSGWTWYSTTRDLPDECDCLARHNDVLAEGEPEYECDCPPTKDVHVRPRRRTTWEALLGYSVSPDPNAKFVIIDRAYAVESREVAINAVHAKHAARRLLETSYDG